MRRPIRGSARLAAVVLVCAGALSCSEPAAPDSSEPTHDLVFEGYFTATPELLVREEDTGRSRRLLEPGRRVMDPSPSPDGRRIAFVVADYSLGTGDIFVINRDGTGLRQITNDPELDDQPTWSPDGKRLAFRSFRELRSGDIWVVDVDGASLRNLTPDPLPGITDERHPDWSPDGKRIAFASNLGGNYDIWTMASDGSDPVRLTATPEFDAEPAWSPDGSAIVFRRSTSGVGSDLALLRAGSNLPQIIPLPGEQRMPTWSPDGEWLVFVNHPAIGDRPDLYRARSDGTQLEPLTTDDVAGGSLNPAFLRR